ncbi:DUF1010 domain-containing protein [Thiopseudomonas alkaliphila]
MILNLANKSNQSLKPTRILRSAYLNR